MNLCANVCMWMCVYLQWLYIQIDLMIEFYISKCFVLKTRVKKDLWSSACSYVFAYVYALLLFFVFSDTLKMHLE